MEAELPVVSGAYIKSRGNYLLAAFYGKIMLHKREPGKLQLSFNDGRRLVGKKKGRSYDKKVESKILEQ